MALDNCKHEILDEIKIEYVGPDETVFQTPTPVIRGRIFSENELKPEEIFESEIKIEYPENVFEQSNPPITKPFEKSNQQSTGVHRPWTTITSSPLVDFSNPPSKGNLFHCNQCCYSTNYKYHLSVHVYRHNGEKEFKCVECPSKFVTNSDLKRHTKIHAPNRKKPFSCDICSRSFFQKLSLEKHQQSHANRIVSSKPMTDLIFQMRKRLQTKTLQCEICEYSSNNSCHMRYHLRLHTETKPSKYECYICKYTVKRISFLMAHMRKHFETQFKCEVCSKKFLHKHHLIGHLFTHTGERPFKCNMCPKRYTQSSHLSTHKRRTHTKGRPRVWNEYSQGLAANQALNLHKQKHGLKKL